MNTITINNKEIALMAFDRLRKEEKKDAALKLAKQPAARHKHIARHK